VVELAGMDHANILAGDGEDEPPHSPTSPAPAGFGVSPVFSYMNPKLTTRLSNSGRGMFAVEPVKKDEILIIWAGKVVHLSEVLTRSPAERDHILQVDEEHYQVPFWPGYDEPANYVNHSCNPTAGFRNSPITLCAIVDIPAGAEITFDYAMSECIEHLDGNCDWRCRCGEALCRGYFTGGDWKRPELWERYGNYFSPYLITKIKKLQEGQRAKPSITNAGQATATAIIVPA